MCEILFLLPNLVAFSCYTVNIHLEKWLMRCDTKRAIWWYLYNKNISIFCIKHMSTIFRTLQVNKWWSKNETFFSFCEINATKFGTKYEISHTIIMQWKKSYYIATNVSSRKSATTFGDLPDCKVNVYETDNSAALSHPKLFLSHVYHINFSVFHISMQLATSTKCSKLDCQCATQGNGSTLW